MRLTEIAIEGLNHRVIAPIKRHGGQIVRFDQLPPEAKKAIVQYVGESGGRKPTPSSQWGYVVLPMADLQQLVMDDLRREDAPFETFDEYHHWYVSHGDTPNHDTIWPIWLNVFDDGMGVIFDGSHRFHHYVRSKLDKIPAIYEPFEANESS